MTPKEKAEELVNSYSSLTDIYGINGSVNHSDWYKRCVKCALIVVDEIIVSSPSLPILGDGGTYGEDIELSTEYWKEVKEELENKL